MPQVPMISEMRQSHNGVGLLVGTRFMADSEAEAADMVAVRVASRDKTVKKQAAAPQVITRTMEAQEAHPAQAEDDTGPVLDGSSTQEDPAVLRAKREQEARDRVAAKPGQHQRRDMRARR